MTTQNPKVEFIIPTYNRPDLLRCILSSLIAQSDPDWSASVMIDDTFISGHSVMPPSQFDTIKVFNELRDSRLTYGFTDGPHKDWGHTPRDQGRMKATAEYTIMTGDDNYYVPTFVAELKKVLGDNPGFVYWDMVHSSFNYQYFKCHPFNGQIDIGAFAVRTDLCKQIKLGRGYAADGEFVEDYKKMFPHEKMVKIDKILYVHN